MVRQHHVSKYIICTEALAVGPERWKASLERKEISWGTIYLALERSGISFSDNSCRPKEFTTDSDIKKEPNFGRCTVGPLNNNENCSSEKPSKAGRVYERRGRVFQNTKLFAAVPEYDLTVRLENRSIRLEQALNQSGELRREPAGFKPSLKLFTPRKAPGNEFPQLRRGLVLAMQMLPTGQWQTEVVKVRQPQERELKRVMIN